MLTMQNIWTFTVSQKEMTLILQALGGRLEQKNAEIANQLCDKLTKMRISQTRQVLEQINGLERSLGK